MSVSNERLKEIRRKSIIDYLQSVGISPCTEDGKKAVYYSPIRSKEKTPSFFVFKNSNRFKDFGNGANGNIISLVELMQGVGFKEAIEILEGCSIGVFDSGYIEGVKSEANKGTVIELKKVKELGNNRALADYLVNERRIPLKVGKEFLREVYYCVNDRHYFALGFENDSKGFEIRNRYFKGCVGAKSYTKIKGFNNDYSIVFEGFMDFLSAVVLYGRENVLSYDVFVLNSLSSLSQIQSQLLFDRYIHIYLFLDNDSSGRKATKELLENRRFKDCSSRYDGFKDLNDFLKKGNHSKLLY